MTSEFLDFLLALLSARSVFPLSSHTIWIAVRLSHLGAVLARQTQPSFVRGSAPCHHEERERYEPVLLGARKQTGENVQELVGGLFAT